MDTTGKVYIAITIGTMIAAFVVFWFVSRRCQKGTLLAVGVFIWITGLLLASNTIREIVLVAGILKLSGIVGGILGLIDVVRKRKGEPEVEYRTWVCLKCGSNQPEVSGVCGKCYEVRK